MKDKNYILTSLGLVLLFVITLVIILFLSKGAYGHSIVSPVSPVSPIYLPIIRGFVW